MASLVGVIKDKEIVQMGISNWIQTMIRNMLMNWMTYMVMSLGRTVSAPFVLLYILSGKLGSG